MSLGKKQELFSRLLPRLLDRAHELGYEVRLRELYRPPEMAQIYAERGTGIANSLHCDGLAIDLVLFWNNQMLTSSEAYRPLGEYWQTLDLLCAWGGSFGDGGHFSLRDGGRA